MKSLVNIRTNTFVLIQDGEEIPMYELVLITETSRYDRNNEGEIVRSRCTETDHVVISHDGLRQMVTGLSRMLDEVDDAGGEV